MSARLTDYLPEDGKVTINGVSAPVAAHHAVGERRNFRIMDDCLGHRIEFIGRLAYDEDFNLRVVAIEPSP